MNTISSMCVIACVAPAALAQDTAPEQAAAQQPTTMQIAQGGVALLQGSVDILKEAKDAASADVAAAGLDQLTAIAKKLDEASKNASKPSDSEIPALQKELAKSQELAKAFMAEASRIVEANVLTDKLKASITEFVKVTDLEKALPSEEEGETEESAE